MCANASVRMSQWLKLAQFLINHGLWHSVPRKSLHLRYRSQCYGFPKSLYDSNICSFTRQRDHCLCDFGLSILGARPDNLDVDLWGVLDGLRTALDSLLSLDERLNGVCLKKFLNSFESTFTFETMFDPYSPIAWVLINFFGWTS